MQISGQTSRDTRHSLSARWRSPLGEVEGLRVDSESGVSCPRPEGRGLDAAERINYLADVPFLVEIREQGLDRKD